MNEPTPKPPTPPQRPSDPASGTDPYANIKIGDIDAVLRRNIANVLKKVEAGRALSHAEKKLFEKIRKDILERSGSSQLLPGERVDGMANELTDAEKGGERRYLVAQRRQQVFELRLAGKMPGEIAAKLKCSLRQIIRDFAHIESKFLVEDAKENSTRILNERLGEFDCVRRLAAAAALTGEGSEKAQFLSLLLQCNRDTIKLLQDAGVLKVAPKRTELSGPEGKPIQTHGEIDFNNLPTDKLLELNTLIDEAKAVPGGRSRN